MLKLACGHWATASRSRPLARYVTTSLYRKFSSSASPAKIHPLELHYTPTPNGWKVTLLLEECGLPYAVMPVDLAKGEQFNTEFLKLSPNGRMPALRDPNDGVSIFESGAIMLHIAENYEAAKPFLPTPERSSAIQWLFWVNAGLGPMAGQCSHFRYYAPQVEPAPYDHSYALDRYSREYDRLISVLDKRVGATGSFLAGDHYGIADSMRAASRVAPSPLSFPIQHNAQPVQLSLIMKSAPTLVAWLPGLSTRVSLHLLSWGVLRACSGRMAVGETLEAMDAAGQSRRERVPKRISLVRDHQGSACNQPCSGRVEK